MQKEIRMLFRKYHEFILYFIFGVLTTLVCWITYAALKLVFNVDNPFQMQIAVILRWVAGVLFAYVTNRLFVFENRDPDILRQFMSFAGSRMLTLLVEMFAMWLFASQMHINDWIATVLCTVIVMVLNYVFSKLIVFKEQPAVHHRPIQI